MTTTRPCPTLTRDAPAVLDRPGLYLLRGDGSLERLFDDISVGSISPDGTNIVFSTGNGGLCLANIAGGPARRLADQYVELPPPAHTGVVEWAPDGHAVIANLGFNGHSMPVVLPVNGPPGVPIQPPGAFPVAWAPDSQRFCAVTGQSLIVMNQDGTNRNTIFSSQGDNSGYATLQWLNTTIYTGSGLGSLVNVADDGSSAVSVNGIAQDFDWRPDGWAVLVNRTQLTLRSPTGDLNTVATRTFNPRWMSDGRLVFWARLDVGEDVRIMDIDGNAQTLLHVPGGDTYLHAQTTAPSTHADLIALTITSRPPTPGNG